MIVYVCVCGEGSLISKNRCGFYTVSYLLRSKMASSHSPSYFQCNFPDIRNYRRYFQTTIVVIPPRPVHNPVESPMEMFLLLPVDFLKFYILYKRIIANHLSYDTLFGTGFQARSQRKV